MKAYEKTVGQGKCRHQRNNDCRGRKCATDVYIWMAGTQPNISDSSQNVLYLDHCTSDDKGARWPSGLERWLVQATGLSWPGSNPTAENFASELWQFRLPRFASVFRRRR